MRRSLSIALTASALAACGKGEPPLPRLASETLVFAPSPTRDEIPRDLRVTLELPAEWARAGGGMVKTFSSGRDEGTIYGALSLEVAHGTADPGQAPAVVAKRVEEAREKYGMPAAEVRTQPGATPGLTIYELDRSALRKRILARAVGAEDGLVLLCTIEMSTGHSATLGERLLEACKTAKLELVATVLPPDLVAAEQAKLAKCPPATNVTIKRDERAFGPATFGPVLAGRAFATSGGKLEIDLANYQHDAWSYAAKPADEGQLRLAFEVFPPADKHAVSGRYPVKVHSFDASSQARLLSAGEWQRIDLAIEDDTMVEVVARTTDKVCGSFAFSDGHHTVRGAFVLDLVVGRAAR